MHCEICVMSEQGTRFCEVRAERQKSQSLLKKLGCTVRVVVLSTYVFFYELFHIALAAVKAGIQICMKV